MKTGHCVLIGNGVKCSKLKKLGKRKTYQYLVKYAFLSPKKGKNGLTTCIKRLLIFSEKGPKSQHLLGISENIFEEGKL